MTDQHEPRSDAQSNGPQKTFETIFVCVPLDKLTPLKYPDPSIKNTSKYQQILATVRAVGLVEPPAVMRDPRKAGRYLLLDGHLRVEALNDLGIKHVNCIISTNDDTYTYNKRINRLSAAQDHRMIARAIELGVSEETIARVFGLSEKTIRQRSRLLIGVCQEAADKLADKPCPGKIFEILKKMVPLRQIEVAEIMIDQDNYSVPHGNSLLRMTPMNQLVSKAKRNPSTRISTDSITRQISDLQAHNRSIEQRYEVDAVHWSSIEVFLKELLGRRELVRWLSENKPDALKLLRSIVGTPEGKAANKHRTPKQKAA